MNSYFSRLVNRAAYLAGACTLVFAAPTHADDNFPSRPVTIVVPFGAGGPPDGFARLIGDRLQKIMNQTVLVENRVGASSTIGTNHVAKAAPDGYTMLYGSTSGIPAAKALFKTLPYDPETDLVPVTVLTESYFMLVGPKVDHGIPFAAFLEKVRKDPAKYPIGGSSTTAQLLNKMMTDAADLEHTYVPYGNSATMMTDVMAGRLGAAFQPVSGVLPILADGLAAGIAVAAPERVSAIPEVPTLDEVLPGIDVGTWTGFFVPAGTPKPIIDKLYAYIQEAAKDPAVIKRTEDSGGRMLHMTPDESAEYVKKESVRWPELLRNAGIQPG